MHTKKLLALAAGLAAVAAALTVALPAGAASQATPTYTFSTATNEIIPSTYNEGWWSTNNPGSNTNPNYEAGKNEAAHTHRNFFSFDITGSTYACTPSSAVLHVNSGKGNQAIFGTGPSSLVYNLYDVSTPASTLAQRGSNPNSTIYADLGSGTLYGSYTLSTSVSNTTWNLALNASALSDLGFAKQFGEQWFSIGGAITPDPSASYSFLFGNTGSSAATLTVTYPKLCRVYP